MVVWGPGTGLAPGWFQMQKKNWQPTGHVISYLGGQNYCKLHFSFYKLGWDVYHLSDATPVWGHAKFSLSVRSLIIHSYTLMIQISKFADAGLKRQTLKLSKTLHIWKYLHCIKFRFTCTNYEELNLIPPENECDIIVCFM